MKELVKKIIPLIEGVFLKSYLKNCFVITLNCPTPTSTQLVIQTIQSTFSPFEWLMGNIGEF